MHISSWKTSVVRVATDPWPAGDAPVNCYHTFAALISEARPQLKWAEHSVLVSDEGSARQVEAEYTLWREVSRAFPGSGLVYDRFDCTAEERLDRVDDELRKRFEVTT